MIGVEEICSAKLSRCSIIWPFKWVYLFLPRGHKSRFQSSSNVIVCIAVDRLIQVLLPTNNCPTRGKKRTNTMLFFAWLVAFAASIPQLFIWSDYPAIPERNWNQCLQVRRMFGVVRLSFSGLGNFPGTESCQISRVHFGEMLISCFGSSLI